jgi:hypothetical protein
METRAHPPPTANAVNIAVRWDSELCCELFPRRASLVAPRLRMGCIRLFGWRMIAPTTVRTITNQVRVTRSSMHTRVDDNALPGC